jgi:hypothetical protein
MLHEALIVLSGELGVRISTTGDKEIPIIGFGNGVVWSPAVAGSRAAVVETSSTFQRHKKSYMYIFNNMLFTC